MEKYKNQKSHAAQMSCGHRPFAHDSTGGKRCESQLGFGTQGLKRCSSYVLKF